MSESGVEGEGAKGSSAAVALVEPWLFAFDYKRSVGPVLGRFLGGLSQERVLGQVGRDGRVQVPPTGYDPLTSEALTSWVEVACQGHLVSWSWVAEPLPTHPFQRPFGWALVRLDGADTALLHALDAPSPAGLYCGMRMRIRWAEVKTGTIRDIVCFEPVEEMGHGG